MQRLIKILKGQKGFTLIELVLVIIILALLVGLAALNMVGTSDDARDAKIGADYDTFATAIKVYRLQEGTYPASFAPLSPDYLDEAPGAEYTFTNVTASITLSNTLTSATKVITKI
jgi:prepilin-type N-terminal cleavage/methylation domain-containing protein